MWLALQLDTRYVRNKVHLKFVYHVDYSCVGILVKSPNKSARRKSGEAEVELGALFTRICSLLQAFLHRHWTLSATHSKYNPGIWPRVRLAFVTALKLLTYFALLEVSNNFQCNARAHKTDL